MCGGIAARLYASRVSQSAQQPVKKMTLEATIIRADGTVEQVGKVAEWHSNPFRRLWLRLRGVGQITRA